MSSVPGRNGPTKQFGSGASASDNRDADPAVVAAQRLFDALCLKHRPTAAHSLRVALGALMWGERLGLSDRQRRTLELASLVHDVGKLATPDHLLSKSSRLTSAERTLMNRCRESGLMLVGSTLRLPEVDSILRAAHSCVGVDRSDRESSIMLAGSILAIADAFDSMTTQQAYRPALSRDEAVEELWRNAGNQFDPELVRRFGELANWDPQDLHERTDRLLTGAGNSSHAEMAAAGADFDWQTQAPDDIGSGSPPQIIDERRLTDETTDGVASSDGSLAGASLSVRGTFEFTAAKLRGFISDEAARILSVDDGRVSLAINGQRARTPFIFGRRSPSLRVDIELAESCRVAEDFCGNSHRLPWTQVTIHIRPLAAGRRRLARAEQEASDLLSRLRGYLMIRSPHGVLAV